MGTTGVILDATNRLLPVTTSRLSVDTERIADVDTLMAAMEEGDRYFRYSVAWIDPMARGRHLGRSVLTRADHATVDQLRPQQAVEPLAYDPAQRINVPPVVPAPGVINHATIKLFNELWYRKAPNRRVGHIESIPGFFHPLDMVGSWNRLYGRAGFLQYQLLVPFGAEAALREVLE